ncbi:MAG: DUF1501 domain-containing protein [Saprospiraceae bacterium]|nr:DUF1501 domain-containing protein [Lewinella sp.]
MKRRQFLHNTGTALSIPVLLNGMPLSAISRSQFFPSFNDDSDKVLVLVQLNGGNDGLSMVIPRDQYSELFKARSNVLIPENAIVPITDKVGFHPVMTGLRSLYDKGQLGIVQSVGYPNQNRSHFRSSDIWFSGSPADEFWTTGWLGRYLDTQYTDYPEGYPNPEYPHPFAITIGNVVSETCQGAAANYCLTITDPFALSPLYEGSPTDVPDTPYGEELAFLRTTILQTNAYGEEVTAAAEKAKNLAEYPEDNGLAQQLKTVALLIAGGLRTNIYVVNIGGFDTHANQVVEGDKTTGEHSQLLRAVSEAVSAFQEDLTLLGIEERVAGMTFSEFGRQIASNDSFGTDHGTAAPLFVFGSCVNPAVTGDNPDIPDQVERGEGVPMQYDFRDVYGSILMDWFEVSQNDIKTLFYPGFTYLPVLNACKPVATRPEVWKEDLLLNNYPNPFTSETTIRFTHPGGHVRLSIFNTLGSELQVLVNKQLTAGEHSVPFYGGHLPAGNYYYRLQVGNTAKTMRMSKI